MYRDELLEKFSDNPDRQWIAQAVEGNMLVLVCLLCDWEVLLGYQRPITFDLLREHRREVHNLRSGV